VFRIPADTADRILHESKGDARLTRGLISGHQTPLFLGFVRRLSDRFGQEEVKRSSAGITIQR
jgi:hypothetical protein